MGSGLIGVLTLEVFVPDVLATLDLFESPFEVCKVGGILLGGLFGVDRGLAQQLLDLLVREPSIGLVDAALGS